MKIKYITISAILAFGICVGGCGNNQTQEETDVKELSMEDLTNQLREGILDGKSEITCTYQGKANELNQKVNEELEDYLAEDYLCKNLLNSVNIDWEQQGKSASGTFTYVYKEDIELPIISAKNEDEIVKGLVEGWESGKEKITVILENQSYEKDEIFAMLDGAEINSASVPCEADNVYFETFKPEGELQILKMWVDLGTERATLQEEQDVLNQKIQKYGEEIKKAEYDNEEEMYRAIYRKIVEIAEYDESIAVVTGMERLSFQMRVLRSAYGALVDGNTVCTGYARGYKALCDYLDLPCQVVAGIRNDVKHSWNRVRVGEEYFYVDCTAGDTGNSEEEACLFTQEQMEQSGYIMDDGYVIPEI